MLTTRTGHWLELVPVHSVSKHSAQLASVMHAAGGSLLSCLILHGCASAQSHAVTDACCSVLTTAGELLPQEG